jgi:hypothetical protein
VSVVDRTIEMLRRRIQDLERRPIAPARLPASSQGQGFDSILVLGGNELPPGGGPGVLRAAAVVTDIRLSTAPDVYPDPGKQAIAGARTISGGVLTAVAAPTSGNGGSAYDDAATKICIVSGGGGSGAVVHANSTAGVVTSFTVVNGGSGYTSAPAVSVPYPTGIPAGLPWPDGVGYGKLSGGQRVLILHDPRAAVQSALIAGQLFLNGQTILLQGRTLYVAWWV